MAIFDTGNLDGLEPSALDGVGYRNQAPGFDPRSGEGARRAGGRFNPPRSFPVVYLCSTRACVVAELTAQADRQSVGLADLLPRELWSLSVSLDQALDLTDESVLAGAGLSAQRLALPDHSFTRQIGEAAYQRGYQAIRSFSATGVDEILVLILDNLGEASLDVELVERWEPPDDLR